MEVSETAAAFFQIGLQQKIGRTEAAVFLPSLFKLSRDILRNAFPGNLFAVHACEFAKECPIPCQPPRFHEGSADGQICPTQRPAVENRTQAVANLKSQIP